MNSYALRLVGITKDTRDPKGQIPRDPETGDGSHRAVAAQAYDGRENPGCDTRLPATVTHEDNDGRVCQYGRGGDAGFSSHVRPRRGATCQHSGGARCADGHRLEPSVKFVESWEVTTGFGDERIKLGALKIFVDGGVTSRTAWFKKRYKDRPDYYGIPEVDKETVVETVRVADRLGWQFHFHTCGDAAVELVLDALEAAQKENHTSGPRHLLTHLYVLSQEQLRRIKRLGVIAVLQPNFVYALGEHMRVVLDEQQLRHLIPFRSLMAAGIPVALSEDGHPQEPLYGIYAAVARKTKTGYVLGAEEAVSVMDALRAYTRTSAYALFEEKRRGSLEPGKIADLIVLDQNILEVPSEEVKDAQVLITVKDGVIVVNRLE